MQNPRNAAARLCRESCGSSAIILVRNRSPPRRPLQCPVDVVSAIEAFDRRRLRCAQTVRLLPPVETRRGCRRISTRKKSLSVSKAEIDTEIISWSVAMTAVRVGVVVARRRQRSIIPLRCVVPFRGVDPRTLTVCDVAGGHPTAHTAEVHFAPTRHAMMDSHRRAGWSRRNDIVLCAGTASHVDRCGRESCVSDRRSGNPDQKANCNRERSNGHRGVLIRAQASDDQHRVARTSSL